MCGRNRQSLKVLIAERSKIGYPVLVIIATDKTLPVTAWQAAPKQLANTRHGYGGILPDLDLALQPFIAH
jgi:hypothetical protein